MSEKRIKQKSKMKNNELKNAVLDVLERYAQGTETENDCIGMMMGLLAKPDTKTGAGLITQERLEHTSKHNWTPEHDDQYTNGELIQAAEFALGAGLWPDGWSLEFKSKIECKSSVERLVVAGAFIAAEIDRQRRLYDYH